jgi:hypothetical protein
VTAVTIKGLDGLRARLEGPGVEKAVKEALREEAEAVAAEVRAETLGAPEPSLEVTDVSQGMRLGYQLGVQVDGEPRPSAKKQKIAIAEVLAALRNRLPRIKHNLARVVADGLKMRPL